MTSNSVCQGSEIGKTKRSPAQPSLIPEYIDRFTEYITDDGKSIDKKEFCTQIVI